MTMQSRTHIARRALDYRPTAAPAPGMFSYLQMRFRCAKCGFYDVLSSSLITAEDQCHHCGRSGLAAIAFCWGWRRAPLAVVVTRARRDRWDWIRAKDGTLGTSRKHRRGKTGRPRKVPLAGNC